MTRRLDEDDDRPAHAAQPMAYGEERTYVNKYGKAITIVRTDRNYAFDLADAYNAAMSEADAAQGMQWFVDVENSHTLFLSFTQRSQNMVTEDIARRHAKSRRQFIQRNDINRPPSE